MDKRFLALAVGAAVAMPALGAEVVARPRRSSGIEDWLRANGKLTPKGKRLSSNPSRYVGRAFKSRPPVDLPGYFWKQDAAGTLWRIYALPPNGTSRHVVYDEANDRSIIESSWGYVKPTYARGDVRGRR